MTSATECTAGHWHRSASKLLALLVLLTPLAGCGSDPASSEDWQPCVAGSPGCAASTTAGTTGQFPASTTGDSLVTTGEPGTETGGSASGNGQGNGGVTDAGATTGGAAMGTGSTGSTTGVPTAGTADAGITDPDASSSGLDAGDSSTLPEAGATGDAVGFVGEHGPLQADGNRIVDAHGQAIQLRGMSLFWSQWTDFYTAQNVDVLVDDWQASVVRVAIGVENDGGYLQDPQAHHAKLRTVVDRAIERGVYVIIDWHDHAAQNHMAQATDFFQQVATEYGDEPNVLFEIYNEPVDVGWPVVKSYAEQMIATIRGAGSNNLIIVGTPTWSQDVDIAAGDPITSDSNVAYTLHFYANTHRQALRDKAQAALDGGIPLFVTEWGTCSADGNGSVDEAETRTWLSFLGERSIGWANWSLHDKAEACSAVRPEGGSVGPWRDDQLTPSGVLVKSQIP